jgi:hypothetical protein
MNLKKISDSGFVNGTVLDVRVIGKINIEEISSINDCPFDSRYEVDIKDLFGNTRTFQSSGKLPEIGSEQSYKRKKEVYSL